MANERSSVSTSEVHGRINLFLTGTVLVTSGLMCSERIWFAAPLSLAGCATAYWALSRSFAGVILSRRLSRRANAAFEAFLQFCQICDNRTRIR